MHDEKKKNSKVCRKFPKYVVFLFQFFNSLWKDMKSFFLLFALFAVICPIAINAQSAQNVYQWALVFNLTPGPNGAVCIFYFCENYLFLTFLLFVRLLDQLIVVQWYVYA